MSSAIRSFSSRAGAHAHQRLGPLHSSRLREVNDVDRCLAAVEELADRLVERGHPERVVEGHRPRRRAHRDRRTSGPAGQVGLEAGHVAEGRGHEHELGAGQLEERDLPRPAAIGLRVEVELVHDHQPHGRPDAVPQGDVGEDLSSAADDRGTCVDGGVARHHADVLATEGGAQVEELLADQRLDRRCVEAAAAGGERREVSADGDQALARAGGCGHDHVRARHDLDQRLLLRRVQRQAPVVRPADEGVEERVGAGLAGDEVGEAHAVCSVRVARRCVGAARATIRLARPHREPRSSGLGGWRGAQ